MAGNARGAGETERTGTDDVAERESLPDWLERHRRLEEEIEARRAALAGFREDISRALEAHRPVPAESREGYLRANREIRRLYRELRALLTGLTE